MRHTTASRAAAVFGAALVISAFGFAWIVRGTTPVEAPGGAEAFQRHCASCHSEPDLRARVRDNRDKMTAFLRDHGDTTDEDDRRILDYLSAPER